jgi:hypothetical protein
MIGAFFEASSTKEVIVDIGEAVAREIEKDFINGITTNGLPYRFTHFICGRI